MRLIFFFFAKSNFNRETLFYPCREYKCKDTVVSLYDLVGGNLEVKLAGNKTYAGLPSRSSGTFLLLYRLFLQRPSFVGFSFHIPTCVARETYN